MSGSRGSPCIKNGLLRILENRMLGKILGHKGEEVTGDWMKLHIETLNDF